MKSILFRTIFLSVLLLIFGCAQTKVIEYQAKSAEEKEVVDVLVKTEKAIQNRNLGEFMASFHDNATIQLPSDGYERQFVSKRQYEEFLESGWWDEYSAGVLANPKITMSGDKATLICFSPGDNVLLRHTFNLIKENEKWSIIKYRYTW